MNVGHLPGSDSLEKVVSATVRAELPVVVSDRVSAGNSLVLASAGSLSGAHLLDVPLPAKLAEVARTVAGRLGPALRGGAVYTDDKAPVEWLTDLSILQYATRH